MPALRYAQGALRNCTPTPLAERPAEVTVTLDSIAGAQIRATFDRRELLIRCDPDYSRIIGSPTLRRLVAWLAKHEEWRVLPALALLVSACGFNGLGPETMIVAETPCGRIEYRSSKDQAAPGAVCRVARDGAMVLDLGADSSNGAGAVAGAVAAAAFRAVGAAK